MATQVQTATSGAQEKVQGTTKGAQEQVGSYTSSILGGIEGLFSSISAWAQGLLDRVFPPEQRAAVLAKLQSFMLTNPKLSTFLGMNILLTGIPLGLFILFTITIFLFSLIIGLLVGLIGAVLFTLACVGTALVVVLPTIMFTTMTACFLFLWGTLGYYVLKWLSPTKDSKGNDVKPLLSSGSIGDSLNNLSGGRLTGFMGKAKEERSKNDISGFGDEHTPPKAERKTQHERADGETKEHPAKTDGEKHAKPAGGEKHANGSAHKATVGHAGDASHKATNATPAEGIHKAGADTTGAVNGGVGGATGLA